MEHARRPPHDAREDGRRLERTITGNSITSFANFTPGAIGIDVVPPTTGSVIGSNIVDSSGGSTQDIPIVVQYAGTNVTVQKNTVTAGAGEPGMFLYHNNAGAVLVQDNNITSTGGSDALLRPDRY